jgi:hypothetical protein
VLDDIIEAIEARAEAIGQEILDPAKAAAKDIYTVLQQEFASLAAELRQLLGDDEPADD